MRELCQFPHRGIDIVIYDLKLVMPAKVVDGPPNPDDAVKLAVFIRNPHTGFECVNPLIVFSHSSYMDEPDQTPVLIYIIRLNPHCPSTFEASSSANKCRIMEGCIDDKKAPVAITELLGAFEEGNE